MQAMNRRRWLQACGLGMLGYSSSPWLPALAGQLAAAPERQRHCILLWMTGGPSQTDTFDMKPDHTNGGEFAEVASSVPGLRMSEHLPGLARHADKLALVRGLSTREGDHGRGTYLMRTGHPPRGPIRYPTIGASLAKQLATKDAGNSATALSYVSVAPYRAFNQAAFSPGFLGPKYAPLSVGATDNLGTAEQDAGTYANLTVDDLELATGVTRRRQQRRLEMWHGLQDRFLASHRTSSPIAHDTVYRRALDLMSSELVNAFDLDEEPDEVRQAYGRGRFGQGCLMARRLVERGVPFVEVSLGGFSDNGLGWDTHVNNFPAVRDLSRELDDGWANLMTDLEQRGLLDRTTILWMGEFGRTPMINDNAGRDHFPAAWTCAFAGGGIAGGQAFGRTSPDGTQVEEGKVSEGDVLATLCQAVGVDPETENISDQLRPIKLAEGQPIDAILT